MRPWFRSAALAVLLAGCRVAVAESLEYTLRPEVGEGRIHVELLWRTGERPRSQLQIPEHWGAHRDVPGLVKELEITGATRHTRQKNTWELTHAPGADLRVRYVIDPARREFDWDALHVPITTANFFHGVGNAFLLGPDPERHGDSFDIAVKWDLPPDWTAITPWAAGRQMQTQLGVGDFRNSVFLAGPLVTERCPVQGAAELTVALISGFEFEPAAFAELVAGLIAEQVAAVRDESFPPFLVTAIPVGPAHEKDKVQLSGSGLYRSFIMFMPPGSPLSEHVDHVLAHELFHYWNGGVLGIDESTEPEEHVYWFSEGLTEYYALRILLESGRWKPEQAAEWFNRACRAYDANPARNASNDEIHRGFWKDRNTVGEAPYQRGVMLGLRWHKLAREHGVPDGLDQLVRTLIRRARAGDFKLGNPAIRAAAVAELGEWIGPEFDRYVLAAETIAVPADALEPALKGRMDKVYTWEPGFDQARSVEQKRVVGLRPGSAAARAGLKEGEELAGWSIYGGDPDKKLVLQVRRNGKVEDVSYLPRGESRKVLQFRVKR